MYLDDCVIISKDLLQSRMWRELSSAARCIYISMLAEPPYPHEQWITVSYEELAHATGLHLNTVMSNMKELNGTGLIERKKRTVYDRKLGTRNVQISVPVADISQ